MVGRKEKPCVPMVTYSFFWYGVICTLLVLWLLRYLKVL
jgi:hypothetical protein